MSSSNKENESAIKEPEIQNAYCTSCGTRISSTDSYCPTCGRPQSQGDVSIFVERQNKSRVTAGALAVIFGVFGAHKFYMGKFGLGLIYLLMCWTLLPAIVGLIEGVIYLTEADEKFITRFS